MCAHAAEYPQAVAYEHSGLYTQQFHHHHQQQQLEQQEQEQQQQYHLYPQYYQNHQQQPLQELQEQHQQYHHHHQQQYDHLPQQYDHHQQQQEQQEHQQQQQQAPPYYQAPVYWEQLPPVAPVIPPLNPIPVPSLDAESRKRTREDIGAEEDNAKRLATTPEILFRLLVSANRVGKLIGKQGMHIKQLRDETGARIRIADSQSPVEERVVLISSKDEPDELKCAAEHALIRAATLIIEPETGEKGVVATIGPQHNVGPNLTRLLISGSQAGCIIGKAGATIQEIRESAAGATVRILPREQLPLCSSASESDRLMQISGEMPQVQRALELVAAKLRENPPRETSSTTLPMIQQHDGVGYVVTLPIIPKVTAEMTVPSSLIGGVIGRGGVNITQTRQLSGATVKVRGQKDGSSHRIIYFEGSSEQVSVAQSLVEALLTQQ